MQSPSPAPECSIRDVSHECRDKAALLVCRFPLPHFNHRLVGLDFTMSLSQKQFNFLKPAARLQSSYLASEYDGNRQSKAKT